MNHADQETRQAIGTVGFIPQGKLTENGGRGAAVASRPSSYRLKRSIELFQASSGELYLLRAGTGDDFVLSEPTSRDLTILRELANGFATQPAIEACLARDDASPDDVAGTLAQLLELGVVERRLDSHVLTAWEEERYDRQLIYFADLAEADDHAELLQQRLGESRVVVLGCGGLGSWTACGLASAGVGELVLIDDDQVELSNLNRQILFRESDIGRPKVEAAAGALHAYNSRLQIKTSQCRIESSEMLDPYLRDADLLICTADWPPYELPRWVNQASIRAGTPYVTAGQMLPMVRIGPWVAPGETVCLECMEATWRDAYPRYEELTRHRAKVTPPAATMGSASGLIGSILATEAIHFLSGATLPASYGAFLLIDLRTMRFEREVVTRVPPCGTCGLCGN